MHRPAREEARDRERGREREGRERERERERNKSATTPRLWLPNIKPGKKGGATNTFPLGSWIPL